MFSKADEYDSQMNFRKLFYEFCYTHSLFQQISWHHVDIIG